MTIERVYKLENEIHPGKVLLILGPRRVGKTTLLKHFLNQTKLKFKFVQGEDINAINVLSSRDLNKLNSYIKGYQLLAIDEAQYIPQIGINLKMLVDANPQLYIIATGSSSFQLQDKTGEPLVGRMRKLMLYGFSLQELNNIYNEFELQQNLENFLIYGTYPEVILSQTTTEKYQTLLDLINSYLFKDILAFERVKKSTFLLNLTQLLAFQVGNLVSINEIARKLAINHRTVERYIDLLEQSFIIYRLYPLSNNPRKEINRKFKIYFYDNGIRNAVINNFLPIQVRNDLGQLWENYIISELIKKRTYNKQLTTLYYWRNYNNAEVDLVELKDGKYYAYEIKFSKQSAKISKDFISRYNPTEIYTINQHNFIKFLL